MNLPLLVAVLSLMDPANDPAPMDATRQVVASEGYSGRRVQVRGTTDLVLNFHEDQEGEAASGQIMVMDRYAAFKRWFRGPSVDLRALFGCFPVVARGELVDWGCSQWSPSLWEAWDYNRDDRVDLRDLQRFQQKMRDGDG